MRGQTETGRWRGGDGVAAWWVAVVALQLGHSLSRARAGLLESNPGLAYNFYQSSCPSAESIVRSVTWAQVAADPALPARLLRLHFHDCFVKVRLRPCSLSLSLSIQSIMRVVRPGVGAKGCMLLYRIAYINHSELLRLCPCI
jgi:peroxidase